MKNLLVKTSFVLTSCFFFPDYGFSQFVPGMAGMKTDCKPLAVYKFDSDMKMQMKTIGKSKDTTTTIMQAFVSSSGKYMAHTFQGSQKMGMSSINTIVDLADSTIYSLMDMGSDQKMMVCMDMKSQKDAKHSNTKDSSFDFSKYKKTGRARTILGYTCYEYKYDDTKKSQSLWLTEENLDGFSGFIKSQSQGSKEFGLPGGMTGAVLAMDIIYKDKKSASYMEVIEYNKDKKTEIKTEEYQKR